MKRGASGLSLVVGVNKPTGMTSHDVVSRCRRIFGERRVGHAGTLDPLASGVLPILVGPATRLDAYLTEHDKEYDVRISFGQATTTDDAQGEVIRTGVVPESVYNVSFAESFLVGMVGTAMQIPPVYSAIKVNGKKACDEARKGNIIELEPREIEIYAANLIGISEDPETGYPFWDVSFHVSKGTYIRALARDIGNALGVPAHVQALKRKRVGDIALDDCVSLDTLESIKERASLDPVKVLSLRFTYANDENRKLIANGGYLGLSSTKLYEYVLKGTERSLCACISGVCESFEAPSVDECIAVVDGNTLAAIYRFEESRKAFKPACVFQIGVDRGSSV